MIKVTVTGLKELAARYDNLNARLRMEMKQANKEVGQHLEDATKRTFDYGGPGWAPLAPFTIARKGHATRLVDTGGLKGGIKHKTIGDFKGEVFPAGPGYPRIHSQFLALVHETPGTTVVTNGFGKGVFLKIPGRPFFSKTAKRERRKVARIYFDAFKRAMFI